MNDFGRPDAADSKPSTVRQCLDLAMAAAQRGDSDSAIAAYEAAIEMFSDADPPDWWPLLHFNLGNAYLSRRSGDGDQNREAAIGAFSFVLSSVSRTTHPKLWSDALNDMGNAFARLSRGDRLGNLEQAIKLYRSALEVGPPHVPLREWALTQHRLALTHLDCGTAGDGEHVEQAIDALRAALMPAEAGLSGWHRAQVMETLGRALLLRGSDDRAALLDEAVQAYWEAAEIYERDGYLSDQQRVAERIALLRLGSADEANARSGTTSPSASGAEPWLVDAVRILFDRSSGRSSKFDDLDDDIRLAKIVESCDRWTRRYVEELQQYDLTTPPILEIIRRYRFLVAPDPSVNAEVVLIDDTPLIVLNIGLLVGLHFQCKVGQLFMFMEALESQGHHGLRDRYTHEIATGATKVLMSHVLHQTGCPPLVIAFPSRIRILGSLITFATEQFLLLHEVAHVEAGHLRGRHSSELAQRYTSVISERDTLAKREEYEADKLAIGYFRSDKRIWEALPEFDSLRCALSGTFTVLSFLAFVEAAVNSSTDTHPLAVNRFEAICRHVGHSNDFDEWLSSAVRDHMQIEKGEPLSREEGKEWLVRMTTRLNEIGAELVALASDGGPESEH
ncbi:MAG: hypothetical protein AB7O28_15805 [Vicinamibacterales bacterium]